MAEADPLGSMDERQECRSDISVAASLSRANRDPVAVRLTNVSTLGIRIDSPQALSVGTLATVTVEGLPEMKAWVAWSEAGAAGLTFAHQPPAALIAKLIAG